MRMLATGGIDSTYSLPERMQVSMIIFEHNT